MPMRVRSLMTMMFEALSTIESTQWMAICAVVMMVAIGGLTLIHGLNERKHGRGKEDSHQSPGPFI